MANDLSVVSSKPLPDLSVVSSQPDKKPGVISSIASAVGASPEVQVVAQPLEGIGEEALNTVQGAKNLVNKVLPSSAQIPDVPGRTMPGEEHTALQTAGRGAEQVGEFAAGDAALEAAPKMLKIAQRYPQLIALLDKYPKAGGILLKLMQGGTVGAAQGVVKGAAESDDQAVKQAKAGALGGAAGGALGEAVTTGGRAVMNHMFGSTPEEAFTMAARPYVKDVNFEDSATRAIPRIEAAAKNKPFKTVGEFVDLLNDERNNIWQKEYQPLVDAHPNDIVDGNPIAKEIRNRKTLAMTALPSVFKNETEEIESIAKDFDNFNLKVPEATEVLKSINSKLNGFYRMSPAERASARVTDGQLTALEGAADALRDQIDVKLGPEAAKIRGDYGAMKDMHRIFARRAMVFNRQAPISLPQALGGIEATAALFSGHPLAALAGAVPFASRWANAPGTLVKRGLSLASPSGVAAGVREAAPKVLSNVGAQIGRASVPSDEGTDGSLEVNQ